MKVEGLCVDAAVIVRILARSHLDGNTVLGPHPDAAPREVVEFRLACEHPRRREPHRRLATAVPMEHPLAGLHGVIWTELRVDGFEAESFRREALDEAAG